MRAKKRFFILIKFLVSFTLIYALYRHIPYEEIEEQLSNLSTTFFPLIAALLLLNTLISAWKWQIILKADSIDVPLKNLFSSYLIGTFCNIFLPSSIGGDAYRIYDIAKYSDKTASSFSSVLADRLSGFLALAILSLTASFLLAGTINNPAVAAIAAAALLGLIIIICALFKQGWTRKLMQLSSLDRFEKIASFSEKCLASFKTYKDMPGMLFKIMGISFLFQLSLITCVYLLALSIDIRISFIYFCAFVPLICLMEAIPISIYAVGVRDLGYAFFFSFAGLANSQTRALALLFLITNIAYSLLGGIVYLFKPYRVKNSEEENKPGPSRQYITIFAITMIVWAIFSWPVPRHMTSGIPFSARGAEEKAPRSMVSGDHLQLMYHFWLAGDMARGKTELFNNKYEFNAFEQSDSSSRYEPGPYYVPFSLISSVASWIGGRAFGWNFSALVSLLLTLILTWQLCRRYTVSECAALSAAVISIVLPYRWITVLGGSPTGFAMAMVPMVLLGIDLAVRDNKKTGGLLAGLGILLAYCSDLHVFFFSVLITPFWCLLALLLRPGFQWKDKNHYRELAVTLFPVAAFTLLAYIFSMESARDLARGTMAKGWSLKETVPYSPWRRGFFTWQNFGITNQIYIGGAIAAVLTIGGIRTVTLFLNDRKKYSKQMMISAFLGAAIILTAALALGTDGPINGLAFRAARKSIPKYIMIRQTAKIFCLMPSLLAVISALFLGTLTIDIKKKNTQLALCTLAAALIALECSFQINPAICLLENSQPAYQHVKNDAASDGKEPRILVLPLWPGNSHWTSQYLHFASLYRIRMMNGYRPSVSTKYINNVFKEFESLNQGAITDMQLDDLLSRKVSYLLLHEDAFPEKVSPFPVSFTLKRLLNHSRLTLLKQHEHVWAFKILEKENRNPVSGKSWKYYFPSRRWEAERLPSVCCKSETDLSASGDGYIAMRSIGAMATVKLRAPVSKAPEIAWMLRLRGRGAVNYSTLVDDGTTYRTGTKKIAAEDWTWIKIPIKTTSDFFNAEFQISLIKGEIDLDLCMLSAGEWKSPAKGRSISIPAACFFHAGYTDISDSSVTLRQDTDPARAILYGPMMPLDKGLYSFRLQHNSKAKDGTLLGYLSANSGRKTPVLAGKEGYMYFLQPYNTPLKLEFLFSRSGDIRIIEGTIARLK